MKREARQLFALFLVPLGWIVAQPVHAQSSTNFKLAPGLTSSGGSSASTNFKITDGVPSIQDRGSSTGFDAVTGILGAFATTATVQWPSTAGTYQMLADPVKGRSSSPEEIFDELGTYNNTVWRFGHFSPADSAYQEVNAGLTSVSVGQGFWLITKDNATPASTGLPLIEKDFSIPLISGPGSRPAFNQVGNPFLFPIAINDLQVFNGATTVLFTSPLNTATERFARVFDPATSGYVNAGAGAAINGRQGFWVKKLTGGVANLIVPPKASATGSPEPSLLKPDEAQWAVAITARQGESVAEPLIVGAAPVPLHEWNSLCSSRAPSPPGGALHLAIPRSGWGALSGDYVRVFEPGSATMSWEFSAREAVSPGEISLGFRSFDLPAGSGIWLEDLATGTTREVADGRSLTFATTGERRFRLTVDRSGETTPSHEDMARGLRLSWPNPFAASTGMVFAVRGGEAIRVDLYDVTGRHARTLGIPAGGAGERVVVWDGRDDDGRSLASGVYLVRWRMGDLAGSTRLVKVGG